MYRLFCYLALKADQQCLIERWRCIYYNHLAAFFNATVVKISIFSFIVIIFNAIL